MAKDTQPATFISFAHPYSAELLIVLIVVLHSDIQAPVFTNDGKVTHPIHSAVLFQKNSGALNEMTRRSIYNRPNKVFLSSGSCELLELAAIRGRRGRKHQQFQNLIKTRNSGL